MKVERDKKYVTRGGDVLRVVCVDNGGYYPVIAVTEDGRVFKYTANGHFFSNEEGSPSDLIREHREPQKIVFEGKVEADAIYGVGRTLERNFVRFADPDTPALTGTRYRVTIEEIVEGGES